MANAELSTILDYLDGLSGSVETIQARLTACQAVGPESGGQGEAKKAALIEKWLKAMGISDIVHCDAPDERVREGLRPNFIATIPGRSKRALWIFGHMDVVPAGDRTLWKTDPWTVVRDGDTLYGRGVEDNQQAIVGMLLLAQALLHCKIVPEHTVKLVFMSDEECGSEKGLSYMLEERPDLFPKDDLYLVPDGGLPDGTGIEVAEKAMLWLKCSVKGVQCHASTPQKGVNALVAASDIILSLTGLAKDFSQTDPLFDPPKSTFVPTRHLENVPSVNIVPGSDVFYMDCRLVPGIDRSAVIAKARERARAVAKRRGVGVEVEPVLNQPATQTATEAPVASLLSACLAKASVKAKFIGIGGGTLAALLRRRGIPAVVWSTIASSCHEPNEHSSIQSTIDDTKVFALMAMRAKP